MNTNLSGAMFTVLGASGYIGSRLTNHLRAQGHTVWSPERGHPGLYTRSLGHVLYCVGLTADFRSRPFDTVEAHVSLLNAVLQRARFDSLLYLSSTRVYLGAGATHEDTPLTVIPGDPAYLYNLTKLSGESLCHASGRKGVRVARLSNVVGPGMDATSGNLVADLVGQARTGHVVLRSAAESAKDYVHVADLLDLLPRIAVAGRSTVYNVASGCQTTHAQWLEWLQAWTGCTVEVAAEAPLQYFPPIDVQRLRAEWGVAPRAVLSEDLLRNPPVLTEPVGAREP